MADEYNEEPNNETARIERNLMKDLEETIVIITSAFQPWENSKTKWINIKTLNQPPDKRPSPLTVCPTRQELLCLALLENKQNIKQSNENDWGYRLNGLYLNHLMLIHEEFCNCCYTNSSDQLSNASSQTEININSVETKKNHDVTNNITRRKSSLKLKTSKYKILTKNVRGKIFKPIKNTQETAKIETSKGKICKKTKDLPEITSAKSSGLKRLPMKNDIAGQKSNTNENSGSEARSTTDISDDEWEDGLNNISFSNSSNDSCNEEDKETTNSNTWTRYKLKCELCDKIFHRPGRLKDHMACQHEGKKFECEICKKEYASTNTLKEHMVEHTEEPKECPECSKKFKTLRNLRQHLKTHKPIGDTWKCNECSKTFFSKHTLKNHKIVHSSVRNFCCDICGKRFKRNSYLTIHRSVHTGDITYNCDVCQATFLYSGQLHKHKKKKHGERDQLCIICGKAFFTAELLKRHERIHSKDPHFKCGECGKAYRSETAYRVHLNTHKGITPKPQKRRLRKKTNVAMDLEQMPTLVLSSQKKPKVEPPLCALPQPPFAQYAYEELGYF